MTTACYPKPMTNFDRADDRRRVFHEITAWAADGFKLQKAEGSAAHRLKAAWAEGNVIWLHAPGAFKATMDAPTQHPQIFVVQHNWAAAFKGAEDFEGGDFRLPYNEVAFEFRISGKRAFALVSEYEIEPGLSQKAINLFAEFGDVWALAIEPFYLMGGEWAPMEEEDVAEHPLAKLPPLMAAQIKAICVSLEAEVAVAEKVEIPTRLNAARIKRGQEPMPDYSIVRLNKGPRQYRIEGERSHSKKRLHFRRGHWRHLSEERRTWVRWHLVGDPDLGFIEKEYRL